MQSAQYDDGNMFVSAWVVLGAMSQWLACAVLLALKLFDVSEWSWGVVFAPIWAPTLLAAAVLGLALVSGQRLFQSES